MPNPTGTGMVKVGSDLERRKWIKSNMLEKAPMSFWAPYKGKDHNSIIMNVNNRSASEGNTVIFDMSGMLEGKPVRGTQTAEGTGEDKKKFSSKVTIESWRFVVKNGTRFYNKNINDLSLGEHSKSAKMLSDKWVSASDQAYFDLGQQTSQFGMEIAHNAFNFDKLLEIDHMVNTGEFPIKPANIGVRPGLQPFRNNKNGDGVYLFVIDHHMKTKLLSSTGAQSFFSSTDIRGNDNRLFSGVLGRIGSLVIVVAPIFNGTSDGALVDADGYYNYDSTGVLSAGLRDYVEEGGTKYWRGTAGYNARIGSLGATKVRKSRGIILGAGAFQFSMGLDPEYHFETYDFKKFSESCLEVWCGARATQIYAENQDYKSISVAGYNWGTAYVDLALNA